MAEDLEQYLFSERVRQRLEMNVSEAEVNLLLWATREALEWNPKLRECTTESWFRILLHCVVRDVDPLSERFQLVPWRDESEAGSPLEVKFAWEMELTTSTTG